MRRRTSIVVTTIFQPAFLDGYLDNLRAFGRESTTTLYVIVDRKTPTTVPEATEQARRAGFDVQCPTLSEQVTFLRRLGLSEDFVPWDTDNRRNVGFLMALEGGCDVLISIDDDNYCRTGSDFVGEHGRVGSAPTATDERLGGGLTGVFGPFFNVCTLLETRPAVAVFPRGFPHYARKTPVSLSPEKDDAGGIIAINAGLWLADPDVDAVTRLAVAPEATAFKGHSVVLGSLWTPLNTQNTALAREAAQAYYYVRMGFELQGLRIDRYGDILSGYLTQKCAKHLGQTVRVGTPVADHRRTPHNLFKDLHQELAGMVLLEELLPWLIEERLEGTNYLEAYLSLAERMATAASGFKGFVWDDGGREFLVETARLMTEWSGAVKRLG